MEGIVEVQQRSGQLVEEAKKRIGTSSTMHEEGHNSGTGENIFLDMLVKMQKKMDIMLKKEMEMEVRQKEMEGKVDIIMDKVMALCDTNKQENIIRGMDSLQLSNELNLEENIKVLNHQLSEEIDKREFAEQRMEYMEKQLRKEIEKVRREKNEINVPAYIPVPIQNDVEYKPYEFPQEN